MVVGVLVVMAAVLAGYIVTACRQAQPTVELNMVRAITLRSLMMAIIVPGCVFTWAARALRI